MKIRTDFVTNSSSSSFIITTKTITEELLEIASRGDYWDKVETLQVLNYYMFRVYNEVDDRTLDDVIGDNNYVRMLYEKYKQKLEEGYKLIFTEVDWNDKELAKEIKDLDNGNSIKVERED